MSTKKVIEIIGKEVKIYLKLYDDVKKNHFIFYYFSMHNNL